MAQAVHQAYPSAEVIPIPLADGGEGTLEVLVPALGATLREGVAGETAIIEVARACGLQLLKPAERNPLIASSRGVGELLMAAYAEGCRHFLVGLGGSAICDGGAGMMTVPGIRNLTSLELLCDVSAPFVGPTGAARAFAPQKGASPEEVEVLETRMMNLAARMEKETGVDVRQMPGAGAAGGLGGALMACLGARMVSGIGRILELVHFSDAVEDASLVITGEGQSDAQTLQGKVPYGVLQNAKGTPVALLSGRIVDRPALESAGFHPVVEVSPRNLPLREALIPSVARRNIQSAVKTLF